MQLRSLVLFCGALLCSCFHCLYGQTPEQEYEKAYKLLRSHTGKYDLFHDGSPEAITATQQMWSAVAEFISEERIRDPTISVASLNHSLCLLTVEPLPPEVVQETDEQQCAERRGDATEVVDLGQHLLLVAPSVGESGTVFLLGERDGKDTVYGRLRTRIRSGSIRTVWLARGGWSGRAERVGRRRPIRPGEPAGRFTRMLEDFHPMIRGALGFTSMRDTNKGWARL